jgi:diadenosine tetraphosphate (Ap4A) HIT family hydrolase
MTGRLAHDCVLCRSGGEDVLWRDMHCRVVLVHDPDYPAFCRVIWNAHVREMSDLGIGERKYLMAVVFTVEQALRELLKPDKINLASLGNQVPHLHWHVIPRFADDAHFPDPVWAARRRDGVPRAVERESLVRRLIERLNPSR